MLTPRDVRILDLNSAWRGVPTNHLMQNAGAAVADVARKKFNPRRVLVLSGLGNNGGDGFAAAQRLASHSTVTVLLAGRAEDVKTPEARNAFASLDRRRVRVESWRGPERFRELAREADLLIDALLGVGAQGPLKEPVRTIVRSANRSRKPILSIDVPTGLGGPLAIRPAATVTLHARKNGMNAATSGSILVRPIGIPPEAETHVGPGDLAVPFPHNAPGSHKGENGRLLIVAGGPYCGAPLLSAAAALRAGTDIVRLYTPQECAAAARAHYPDLIVDGASQPRRFHADDLREIAGLVQKTDAVLLGPGLGNANATLQFAREVITCALRNQKPLVLDADALVAAGKDASVLRRGNILATPHHREFRDLTGKNLPEDPKAAARTAQAQAKKLGITILLKGPTDVITDGRRLRWNDVHHPWMTVGGTGDVLAGLSAGLVAKGLPAFEAACAAAFLNGAAGLQAFEEKSWGARATDLLDEVPRVLRDWVASPNPAT